MKLTDPLEAFFFKKISATGFGAMRAAWGLMVFFWMLTLVKDVPLLFSNEGLLPTELLNIATRSHYRYSLLDILTSPTEVYVVYLIMLGAALLTAAGLACRFSTILTLILLMSFHERNLLILGGGDKVLICIGFLLAIAPEIRMFSVDRIRQEWRNWQKQGGLLPPLQMSIWPYRLLLWQVMLIYFISGFEKATGTMWWDGTGLAAVYHHTHFARWPRAVMDPLSSPFISTTISYYTLLYEIMWLGILVPILGNTYKQMLLLLGMCFHVGIFIMTDVGSFAPAMLMAYCGLMLNKDWADLRTWCNRRLKNKILVFNDGHCGFCRQTGFVLRLSDWLGRLNVLDLHDRAAQKQIAEVPPADLLAAMHVKNHDGTIYQGFYAFRALMWHLPATWITLPLWYLPGVAIIGEQVYGKVARSRTCHL